MFILFETINSKHVILAVNHTEENQNDNTKFIFITCISKVHFICNHLTAYVTTSKMAKI